MKTLLLFLTLAPLALVDPSDSQAEKKAPSIVDVAAEAGTFETLLAAAKAAGLAETLDTKGPLTVFAPTDEAFAALPKDAVAVLLRPENKQKLIEILSYHVVPGAVRAADAVKAGKAKTLTGDGVEFAIREGRLRVNDANVVANDIVASNGIVHVIDKVLTPPSGLLPPKGRLVIGVYTARPSAALCAQLGLDPESSFVITRVLDGPARKAGIQPYDVIVAIDGKAATDGELMEAKQRAGFGNTIELELFRGGERRTARVGVGIERH